MWSALIHTVWGWGALCNASGQMPAPILVTPFFTPELFVSSVLEWVPPTAAAKTAEFAMGPTARISLLGGEIGPMGGVLDRNPTNSYSCALGPNCRGGLGAGQGASSSWANPVKDKTNSQRF